MIISILVKTGTTKELKTGFRSVHVTPPSQDGGIDINAYVEEKNVFFAQHTCSISSKKMASLNRKHRD